MKFKNAARFLPEWIEFHQIVGFQHFYLYNNNGTDNYIEALAPYRDEGSVTLMNGQTRRPFQKLMSTVLHIIGTKLVGQHFWMMMNCFSQVGVKTFERF